MQLNFISVDWSLGINVTICGIVIVFSMLVLLVFILTLFGLFFKEQKPSAEKSHKDDKIESINSSKTKQPSLSDNIVTASDEDEIVAVIAAAVAAMYDGSTVTPIIRRIKPSTNTSRPAWSSAGIYENTRAF